MLNALLIGQLGALLPAASLRWINHLLAADPAMQAVVRGAAGRVAKLDIGPFHVGCRFGEDGFLATAASADIPHVTLSLPASVWPKVLLEPKRAMSFLSLQGDADLAQRIGQLAQHLRWDIEADLASVVGDTAAVHLVRLATRLLAQAQSTGEQIRGKLMDVAVGRTAHASTSGEGFAVQRETFKAWVQDIASLRDAVARAAKRIERLQCNVDHSPQTRSV